MKKKDRANYIVDKLEELYPDPPIPLNHSNAFTLLIAVIMSAQSTDKKVNELTPKLFQNGNSPKYLSEMGEEEIYKRIKHIGLAKTKAKNIFKTSILIQTKFNGKVPNKIYDLESLAGVGHKTASVIMSQVYNIPSFPIDTHIHRLAQRWGLTEGKSVKQTEKDLKQIFPRNLWNKLHLQIIYYGREYCTAKACHGISCQICTALYPNRKKYFIHQKA